MTIMLKRELEQKIEAAAKRAEQDVNGFVSFLLRRELAEREATEVDKQEREERLRREFEEAMSDPMFVQDMEETMEAYKYIDAETARMMDEEEKACPVHRSAVDILAEAPGQRVFKTAAKQTLT